jgi:transcriptional regulator with XRE-family HTH domain
VQGRNTNALDGPEALPAKLLAANVVRLRAEVGWSTRAFAQHTGLSLGTLYEIEHSKYRTVSINTLDRLARGFGIHVSCLVSPPGTKNLPFSATPTRETIASNDSFLRSFESWLRSSETTVRAAGGASHT